jgi:hypothetical protein
MLAMFYGMPIWFALPLALLCEAVHAPAIAAAARSGETTQLARSEGPQSGGVKQPHRPNTGGHST